MSKVVIAVALAVTALLTTGLLVHTMTKKETPHHIVNVSVPTPVFDAWTHWKSNNNKAYGGSEEEQHRLGVFHENFQKVAAHSANPARTFEMSLNQFADLTVAEFKALYLSVHAPAATKVKTLTNDAAASVDWTKVDGVVTPVKDQGMCGSCWAFSTTGSMEAALNIKNKATSANQVSLSEQQLVDCSTKFGNQGCNGGLMDQGFQYIEKNGLVSEADYAYKGVDGKCKVPKGKKSFTVSDYTDVAAGDVDQLAKAVTIQPVSIAVDAEQW